MSRNQDGGGRQRGASHARVALSVVGIAIPLAFKGLRIRSGVPGGRASSESSPRATRAVGRIYVENRLETLILVHDVFRNSAPVSSAWKKIRRGPLRTSGRWVRQAGRPNSVAVPQQIRGPGPTGRGCIYSLRTHSGRGPLASWSTAWSATSAICAMCSGSARSDSSSTV